MPSFKLGSRNILEHLLLRKIEKLGIVTLRSDERRKCTKVAELKEPKKEAIVRNLFLKIFLHPKQRQKGRCRV
jgi:predicted YcjX-like family ATPase